MFELTIRIRRETAEVGHRPIQPVTRREGNVACLVLKISIRPALDRIALWVSPQTRGIFVRSRKPRRTIMRERIEARSVCASFGGGGDEARG